MKNPDKVLVDIIQYVYHYEITNADSFRRARELFLDALGCAMESLDDPDVKRFIGPPVKGTIVPGGFCLPGTNIQLDPVKGAFDLGSAIRYLDHNDALGGVEWGHPSDNLGAIVAVMDWRSRSASSDGNAPHTGPPLTIKTLLIAMIKAYEIEGCFQVANSFNSVSMDHTILVKVASTAVISWLLGLSEEHALAALSQAWMDGHPLRTYRAAPNTITRKGWAAGDACMRAVHLTLLTMNGQDGAPNPLTVPRWGFYAALFRGKEFSLPVPYGDSIIHRAVVKLIACEGHGLTGAEAALQLSEDLKQRGLDPADAIEKVEIRTQKPAMIIIDKTGDLVNAADRDHCMQYVVAVVLLKGSLIESADYQNGSPWASDPRVAELRAKMTMTEDLGFTKAYYNFEAPSAPTGIKLLLKDGTWTDEAVVHIPIGAPGATNEYEGVNITSKFQENLKSKFSPSETEKLQKELENDDMQIHEYMDLWVRK